MLSLATLTLQNSVWVLALKASRMRSSTGEPMYLASVAVMLDETIKLVACVVLLFLAYRKSKETVIYQEIGQAKPVVQQHTSFLGFFKEEVFGSLFEFFKMAVPAICYSVQKNLLFLGVSNLDAGTFQVLQQGKILTTALFAVVILKKVLNSRQLMSLVLLVVGAALVQLSTLDSGAGIEKGENPLVGFLAVVASCFTSGFASIYFEWILKGKVNDEPKPSYDVWVRNFQLATFGASSAAVGVFVSDGPHIAANGGSLLQGFTPLVWFVVGLQAFGGLIVALVIKYADTILKNFATSVAIVSAVLVSVLFMGFVLTLMFSVGALCVISAVMLYTSDPNTPLVPSWLTSNPAPLQTDIKA